MSKTTIIKLGDASIKLTEFERQGKTYIVLRAGDNIIGKRPGQIIKSYDLKPDTKRKQRRSIERKAREMIFNITEVDKKVFNRLKNIKLEKEKRKFTFKISKRKTQEIDATRKIIPRRNIIEIKDTTKALSRPARVGGVFLVRWEQNNREKLEGVIAYGRRFQKRADRLTKNELELLKESAKKSASAQVINNNAISSDMIIQVQTVKFPLYWYDIEKKSGYARPGDIPDIDGFKPDERLRFKDRPKRFREEKIQRISGFPRRRFEFGEGFALENKNRL